MSVSSDVGELSYKNKPSSIVRKSEFNALLYNISIVHFYV